MVGGGEEVGKEEEENGLKPKYEKDKNKLIEKEVSKTEMMTEEEDDDVFRDVEEETVGKVKCEGEAVKKEEEGDAVQEDVEERVEEAETRAGVAGCEARPASALEQFTR